MCILNGSIEINGFTIEKENDKEVVLQEICSERTGPLLVVTFLKCNSNYKIQELIKSISE